MTYIDVQLYEPDGTPNLRCSYEYAMRWCELHPGWTWEHIE